MKGGKNGLGTKEIVKATEKASATNYVPVYQNLGVNTLAFLADGLSDSPELRPFINSEGKLEYTKDGVLYKLDVSKKFLTVRTHQFLMYAISKFTKNVRQGASAAYIENHAVVDISFQELAEAFGITVNNAKRIAIQAASVLRALSIYTYWQTKTYKNFEETGLVEEYNVRQHKVTKQGFVKVTFSKRFSTFMAYMSVMMFPVVLWKVSPREHPYSYRFGYWMAMNLKMNFGKKNWNRVSVLKLLDIAEGLPKRHELGEAAQVHKRIITPFIRNLDVLVLCGFLSEWHFEYKGNAIAKEEYTKLRYDKFVDCQVVCHFMGGPEEIYFKSASKKTFSLNTVTYEHESV